MTPRPLSPEPSPAIRPLATPAGSDKRRCGLLGRSVRLLVLAGALWSTTAIYPGAASTATAASPSFTWTTGTTAGPPPLRNPAMAYDGDTQDVVLFGGTLPNGTLSNQTWVFNGTSWSAAGGGPAARSGASMAFDAVHHQLILFGGLGANGNYLGDTWAWNGASWYLDTPSGALPPGRRPCVAPVQQNR